MNAPVIPNVVPALERGEQAAFERFIKWNERAFRLCDENYVPVYYEPVWIDVRKLDALLPLASKMHHVGFAGKNGIRGKYTGVDNFVRSAGRKPLNMPSAEIQRACMEHPDQDIVYLFNGRHRFAWMRDHGAQALPVAAPISEASEVARLVGSDARICRVRMSKIPECKHF
jgi:hypothetical protein